MIFWVQGWGTIRLKYNRCIQVSYGDCFTSPFIKLVKEEL